MIVNYKGNDVDFTIPFCDYCKEAEGYRNTVYRDIKDYPTVGIGHLVLASDNLSVGDVIDDARVLSLFQDDYNALNIEDYVSEVSGYGYNMMLAVGHFIWSHGNGQYKTSQLRSGLLNNTFDAESVQTYLAANWDIHSSREQNMNMKDFEVGFSSTPWEPGFFLRLQTHSPRHSLA